VSPRAAAANPAPPAAMAVHLARFGRALRQRGAAVTLSDEADGLAALSLVDLGDRPEVRRTLRIALKIRQRDAAAFDELFDQEFPAGEPQAANPAAAVKPPAPVNPPVIDPAQPPERSAPPNRPPAKSGQPLLSSPLVPALFAAGATSEVRLPEPDEPGYSPEALLRRKSFDQYSAADLQAMEHLLSRLGRLLATRPSRRRVPVRGRGEVDLRRSFRRAVGQGGEFLSLARRARAIEEPRLVVLCDTSGSMDPHSRFLLGFVLALRRVAGGGRASEIFAFNTSLVRLTPMLATVRSPRPGEIDRTLARLAASVPDWSGGTRIGECLADFVAYHLDERVDARTVVLILSDGLDRGDLGPLAGAMRAIRARARRVLWLNPLAGDSRYEPTARAMAAALPHVDRLLPAHNLESLERLLPLLSA
jgi:uncharacterized protein with von Willebrand factor type A (vWA) domain